MHRPRPLLSLARPLIFLSFWFVLPQIQHDRLVIHSTVKLLLVHPLENKPSVSFPPPSSGSFSVLSFFPLFLTQHSSLSVGLSSPCLSVLLQSHLASRRLHSASYPFLKSAFQRGPAFLASLSSFFLSMRIFQLQNTRVRNHTLLSNPIKSCWMGSSDLAVKKVPPKNPHCISFFHSLAIRSTSSSFLYCSASCNCTPFSLVLVLFCCFSLWANSLYIPQPCFFHSADCQPSESNCGKTHSSSQPSSSFPLNVKASLWL